MKSHCKSSLVLLALFSTISLIQTQDSEKVIDPDNIQDIIREGMSEDQILKDTSSIPAQTFRRKGSYEPKVHLLSQLSEPSPMAKFSVVFPDYFGKDTQKNLLELSMKQGDNQRIVVGMYNHGIIPLYVKEITGAFYEEGQAGEPLKYVQNFTIDSLSNTKLLPSESQSIAYEFFPYASIPAKNYKLILAVFYSDDQYEYSNVVFNGHVDVTQSEQQVGITGLFSTIILTGGIVFLIVFIIKVKIEDRYASKDEGRRKRASQGGALETLRSIISSQN